MLTTPLVPCHFHTGSIEQLALPTPSQKSWHQSHSTTTHHIQTYQQHAFQHIPPQQQHQPPHLQHQQFRCSLYAHGPSSLLSTYIVFQIPPLSHHTHTNTTMTSFSSIPRLLVSSHSFHLEHCSYPSRLSTHSTSTTTHP